MTLRTRRFILLTLAILFLLSGPLLILYASGWRFNFLTYKIERVGAIFLSSNDRGLVVKLDNRIVKKKIGEFSKGLLLDNLSSKSYRIEVSKPGFQTWKKYLTVQPALITQSQPIVLMPEKINFTPIRSRVIDFDFQKGFLVWQDSNGHFFLTNPANLESSLNLTLLFNHLKEKQLRSPGPAKINEALMQDANQFLLKSGKTWYLLDSSRLTLEYYPKPPKIAIAETISPDQEKLATTSPKGLAIKNLTSGLMAMISLTNSERVQKITWHQNSAHILMEYKNSLYLTETDIRSAANQYLISDSVKNWAYDADQNRIYLLSKSGDLGYWDFTE